MALLPVAEPFIAETELPLVAHLAGNEVQSTAGHVGVSAYPAADNIPSPCVAV